MPKPNRSEYDSIEGITKFLHSYPSFHTLLERRREAVHERGEQLNDFIVRGVFSLDQFAQIGRIHLKPSLPEDVVVPPVMARDAFCEFYRSNVPPGDTWMENVLSPVYIPPLFTKCPECGKYYGVDDCHDVMPMQNRETYLELKDFIGRNFWEVRRYLKRDHDVSRTMHPDILIRNDRFIDLRQNPYYDWESPLNKNGWLGRDDGIDDSYVIQPGDGISYNETRYYHSRCFVDAMKKKSFEEFHELLLRVGFSSFDMKPVPNEYGSFEYRGSWFSVATPEGVFTIGWRKRVIEITLHDWPVDCARLFVGEGVTVDNQYVHAYGWDKAVEYLQVILQATKTVNSTLQA